MAAPICAFRCDRRRNCVCWSMWAMWGDKYTNLLLPHLYKSSITDVSTRERAFKKFWLPQSQIHQQGSKQCETLQTYTQKPCLHTHTNMHIIFSAAKNSVCVCVYVCGTSPLHSYFLDPGCKKAQKEETIWNNRETCWILNHVFPGLPGGIEMWTMWIYTVFVWAVCSCWQLFTFKTMACICPYMWLDWQVPGDWQT